MGNNVWIQDNNWQEVEEYLENEKIIILPVGSTEQHGPASAVGLDAYVAIFLAEDAAKENNLLVAPPVWYGDSAHHDAFPGTISITSETFIHLLKDILRNLIRQGFTKVLMINGNKIANLPAMQIAAKEVHEYDYQDSVIAIADPARMARGIAGKLKGETIEHHAGLLEVSQLMYKRPELVDKEKLEAITIAHEEEFSKFGLYDLFGTPHNPEGDFIETVWNSQDEKRIASVGQFSDNSKASAEIGKQYHEYMIGVLSEYIEWMRKQDVK